jgi:cytochrome c oxidase subunit 2
VAAPEGQVSVPGFSLLPASASDAATHLDALALGLLLLTGAVALGVMVLMTWFCVRYRAGTQADRSDPPARGRALEIAWIALPLALFFGIYAWGAIDYARLYAAAPNARPVFIVAKQWMWKAEHPDGRREINTVHLALGKPVRLLMTSQDVIHSFFVPAFRIKQDVVPGRYTSIGFTPTREGDFHLFCAEFCGTDHAVMGGDVIVLRPAAYARWVAGGHGQPGMAARGFALFRRYGCSGCHAAGSSVHAPDLNGIYGRRVHLQDGRELTADDAYLRDAILLPARDVVAGYAPIMPSFAGQIGEEDLLAILQYLRETAHD